MKRTSGKGYQCSNGFSGVSDWYAGVSTFNELEIAVLDRLLVGDLRSLVVLRSQVPYLRVVRRDYTGAGFFTYFEVSNRIERLSIHKRIVFGDVQANIPSLSYGVGFLLYVVDGALQLLEGYTYEEPWPASVDGFKLVYDTGGPRDLAAIDLKFADAR